MTLEEKAEEYADKQYAVFEPCAGERYNVEQAYIAGANEVKADCDFALEGKDVEIKELRDNYEQYKAVAEPTIKELKQENNKLLDVINNQDVKIADLEKKLEKMKKYTKCNGCVHQEEHLNAVINGKQGSAICMLECNASHSCFELKE